MEGPNNPGGLILSIYAFVFVKVHMCICMLKGWMRSELTAVFL